MSIDSDRRPYVPVAFISDAHLFNSEAEIGYLLELLQNTRFGAIILTGDWDDSIARVREEKRFGKIPDKISNAVLTVLDELNKKRLEEGMRLALVPGNHDNGYRPLLDKGREADLAKTETLLGMKILPPFLFKTQSGASYLTMHGDILDSAFVRHVLYHIGDTLYSLIAKFAHPFKDRANRDIVLGKEFISGENRHLKHITDQFGAAGLIFGHTHAPGYTLYREKNGQQRSFYNTAFIDGDPCFLAVDEKGALDLVNWRKQRERLGLHGAPQLHDDGASAYRTLSLRQIAHMQTFKPLSKRDEDHYIALPDPAQIATIRQADLTSFPAYTAIPT